VKRLYSIYFKVIAFFLATFIKLTNISKGSKENQILIVKPDAVGDFFIFLQFIHNIRDFYPHKEFNIKVLVNQINENVAKEYLDVDEIVSFNRSKLYNSLSYFLSLIWRVKGNYNEIIYPCYSRESLFDILIYSLQATKKSSFKGDSTNSSKALITIGNSFYNYLIKDENANELTRIDNFFQQVIPNYNYTEYLIKTDSNDPLLTYIEDKTIGIFPGASWRGRCWEPEKYGQLIEVLIRNGHKIVLLGGPTDIQITEDILRYCQKPHQIINLVGKTSLINLTNIISKLELLITSESCAVHIAQVTQTKSITLLGGGHFERFLPFPEKYNKKLTSLSVYKKLDCFYCGWHCPFSNPGQSVPCIEMIETISIINRFKE